MNIKSEGSEVSIEFDVVKLGELLGIPCDGFAVYKKKKWPTLPVPHTSLGIAKKYSGNPARASKCQGSKEKHVCLQQITVFFCHIEFGASSGTSGCNLIS